MYLIFGGRAYHPSGGGSDFIDKRDDLEDAVKLSNELIGRSAAILSEAFDDIVKIEWTNVFCVESGRVVHRSGGLVEKSIEVNKEGE